MKTYIKSGDEWALGTPSQQNEEYKIAYGNGLSVVSRFSTKEHLLSISERQWRDSELERTDRFVVIPDSPKDYTAYRQELRDYPNQPDFPNGERPSE